MSKKMKLIPELRFPEFVNDGEWAEKNLDKIGDFVGGGTPSTSNSEYWDGGIHWYTPTEVKNGKLKPSIRTITEEGLKNSSARLLPKGTILITTRATIGDAAIADYKCTTNQGFQSLIVNKKEVNVFWYYWILRHKNKLVRRSSGSTFKEIGKNEIKIIPTLSPKKEEQQKIASCLSSLDELITAHSDKLEALKDHKKCLMQNLFPQKGRKVPNYRFPEFEKDGEWVEEKLGNCLLQKPEYGMNAPAVPFSDSLPTYLRITDISEEGNFLSKGKVSVDREVTANDYLSEGDIVLARTGASVGKSYKYRQKDGELVFAGFLIRVKPNPKRLNSELLFQILATSNYWEWVRAVSVRSGQPGINGTQYSNMPIDLPPMLEEQQKIASCLSSLDELITAQSEKIEQLQQHKKGLMQGLFPNTNEIR